MSRGAPYPTASVVAPGQTVILDSFDGQYSYPPLTPGSYRFSVGYSFTSIPPTASPASLKSIALVKLTTTPVTLTSAQWIPSWYHQRLDCPRISS